MIIKDKVKSLDFITSLYLSTHGYCTLYFCTVEQQWIDDDTYHERLNNGYYTQHLSLN